MERFNLRGLGIISITLSVFASCSTTQVQECPDRMCTMEFRTITIRFNDSKGNPIQVKDYSAVNRRTNSPMRQDNEPSTISNEGIYIVASDADTKNLSEGGDTIRVVGYHPQSNEKLTADLVVSGGPCACHVSKLSGPDTLKFR